MKITSFDEFEEHKRSEASESTNTSFQSSRADSYTEGRARVRETLAELCAQTPSTRIRVHGRFTFYEFCSLLTDRCASLVVCSTIQKYMRNDTLTAVATATDSAQRRRSCPFACSDSTSSAGLSPGTSPEDCSPAQLPRRSGSTARLATAAAGSCEAGPRVQKDQSNSKL
mgnify:CR=1 FL=1